MSDERFILVDAVFYCHDDGEAIHASGRVEGEGVFCVLKGSTAKGSPNCTFERFGPLGAVRSLGDDRFEFLKDFHFKSATSAARAVLGRPVGGASTWRTKAGQTLGELVKGVD